MTCCGVMVRGTKTETPHSSACSIILVSCLPRRSQHAGINKTNTHINKCQCSPSSGTRNCHSKQDAYELLLRCQNRATKNIKAQTKSSVYATKYSQRHKVLQGQAKPTPTARSGFLLYANGTALADNEHKVNYIKSFLRRSTEQKASVKRKPLRDTFTQSNQPEIVCGRLQSCQTQRGTTSSPRKKNINVALPLKPGPKHLLFTNRNVNHDD